MALALATAFVGSFLTVTKNAKGEVTNVLVTSGLGGMSGFGSFGDFGDQGEQPTQSE